MPRHTGWCPHSDAAAPVHVAAAAAACPTRLRRSGIFGVYDMSIPPYATVCHEYPTICLGHFSQCSEGHGCASLRGQHGACRNVPGGLELILSNRVSSTQCTRELLRAVSRCARVHELTAPLQARLCSCSSMHRACSRVRANTVNRHRTGTTCGNHLADIAT